MCESSIETFQTPIKDLATGPNCAVCFCGIFSPIILDVPVANTVSGDVDLPESCVLDISTSGSIYTVAHQRLEKSYWVCDYSDDILESLREEETKRYIIGFRSQQHRYRPALLHLLKMASEKYNLARTTLHLAVYLLDYFMDNFTIRLDKLNLTTITSLMVAAKMEEADVDMPKFAKLNELVGGCYTLAEMKNVENKLLTTFGFNLLRPTAATFSEFYAHCYVTLDDYHIYVKNFNNNNSNDIFNCQQQQLPLFTTFDEMLIAMNEIFFALVDMSLNYLKFANMRPSLIAAACVAAVRQLLYILPVWTPYLEYITKCRLDVILPYVDILLALYKLHKVSTSNNERVIALRNVLCDSPDSGVFSAGTKSCRSSAEDSEEDEDEDNTSNSLEYPLLSKRRRIF